MSDHVYHRRQWSGRANSWPNTTLAHSYLTALIRWASLHYDDDNATVVLPVGHVNAAELMRVLRALEIARSGSHA